MHCVKAGISRCMSVVAGALIPPRMGSSADVAPSAQNSTLLFTSDWAYAITAAVMVLLFGAALAVLLKRRSPPAITATVPSVLPAASQEEDSRAVQRVRKEELAATSGMLGALLDQYLRSRFYHLLLIYSDVPSLQKRLSEVAGEYAAVSFFYFCKLISLLAECESQSGGMPLLSSQVAHDAAQRLINSFLSSIPQGEEEGSVDTFEIAAKFTEHRLTLKKAEAQSGTPNSQVADFVRRVDPQRYVSEGTSGEKVHDLLVKEFVAYEKWLKLAPPALILGAEALRAFCRLVSEDLRGVGDRGWRISSSTRLDVAESSALRVLSDKLTAVGLEEILSESPLPRPIGVFLRKAPLQKMADLIQQTPQATEKVAPTPVDSIRLTPDQYAEIVRKAREAAGGPSIAQTQIGTQIVQQQDRGFNS